MLTFYANSPSSLKYEIVRFLEKAQKESLTIEQIIEAIQKARIEQAGGY